MAHEGVKHDYHLVNPSIWPLFGSASAVLLALGLVVGLKGIFGIPKGSWWLLALGAIGVLWTMAGWWVDVTKEANGGDHTKIVSIGLRYGMMLFITSEVMFFVAWFWIFFEMALFHHVRAGSAIDDVRTAWASWPPKGIEVVPPLHQPPDFLITVMTKISTTKATSDRAIAMLRPRRARAA